MVRLAHSAHDKVRIAMSAWNGRNANRGLSRFGRSPSSGLSVGRTPASSANVGFASCVFRCGIGRAGSCDADGSSDCASMAVRLLGRDGFRACPIPAAASWRPACQCRRPPCGWHGWGECREMQICPCIQHWRMHGHTVQPKRLLWSENAGYPHSWRVAWCGRTRVLLCGPSRQKIIPRERWRRSSEP